jgi:hypothetical protein
MVRVEFGLDRTPQFIVDDPLVLTGIRDALVDDLAQVDPVPEEVVECSTRE